MIDWLINHIYSILGGTGLIIAVLSRLLPDDKVIKITGKLADWLEILIKKIQALAYVLGRSVTLFGSKKIGKIWEPIENLFERGIDLIIYTIRDGHKNEIQIRSWKERFPSGALLGIYENFWSGTNSDNGVIEEKK